MLVGVFLQTLFKFCIRSTTKKVLPHLLGPPTNILKFSTNLMSCISVLDIVIFYSFKRLLNTLLLWLSIKIMKVYIIVIFIIIILGNFCILNNKSYLTQLFYRKIIIILSNAFYKSFCRE